MPPEYLDAVVALERSDDEGGAYSPLGSGVIVARELDDEPGTAIYLVTNRHVIEKDDVVHGKINGPSSTQRFVLELLDEDDEPMWFTAGAFDVAVTRLASEAFDEAGARYASVPAEDWLSVEQMLAVDIGPGDEVFDVVVDEDFVLRIPDGLELDVAAPLLCAGITTYSPLRHWNAGPGKHVAVVGLGGLGHMAVNLARAMGADVTVLSQSLRKQEDGLRLGADAYHATSDDATFDGLAGRFDLIVNTVSAGIDIGRFLTLLKTDGALVNAGAPPEPLQVPVFPLILQRRSFAGSAIGSIRETQEMLDFCAEHEIAAEIEIIAADQINEAWERVLGSDVRYRFVIDNSTLQPASR